jgi:hypothetical protein
MDFPCKDLGFLLKVFLIRDDGWEGWKLIGLAGCRVATDKKGWCSACHQPDK